LETGINGLTMVHCSFVMSMYYESALRRFIL
jgi:hypothetical protein